ncbi:MAG: endonuclease domain-containing protein [Caulobacterales bacterium]|nr:endonuclease domain-containing protein [Caulobacterales bacterium]MCA0371717.1 DUF559 domain-containing protein [Pseudomonadota bacterium]
MRNPITQNHAKDLRKNLTKAEAIIWNYLKGKKIEGVKFRRQFPIGIYIVDFAAVEIKLIIEIDGATHSSDDRVKYDNARTQFLTSQGWKVIRVWNNDIYNNLNGILQSISQIVQELKLSKSL